MKSIAIITARGGSKRIPKKNIKLLLGKPIISYSIQYAIDSGLFEEVMVSTDDIEIAEIAKQYGASVPFLRSEETSNDFATTEDVLIEVLECYEKKNLYFDYVCCIYPTAPFVTADKLIKAFELLVNNDCDSVIPVVPFSYPPQRGFIKKNLYLKYQYPKFSKSRSQDLETIYHDAGQFYFCKTKALKTEKDVLTKRTIPLLLPETEVQDIDNYSDWVIAEIKYKRMEDEE